MCTLTLVGAAACSSDDVDTDIVCPSLAPLEATDVSFMFPLPAMGEQPSMRLLGPDAKGDFGELYPRALSDEINALRFGPQGFRYTQLYITAVRFDPCARAACDPELRLVVQQLSCVTGCVVEDAALHLFYAIDPDRVASLARDLRMLKAVAPAPVGQQLAPHPVIEMEGLDGPYATLLKKIILRYAGEARLGRIARMTSAAGMAWEFELVTRDATGLHPQAIARTGGNVEEVSVDLNVPSNLLFKPALPDPLLARLLDSTQWAAVTEQQWSETIDSSLRVENPMLTSVDDVDCASCHVTGRARTRALAARPIDVTALPSRFDVGPMTTGDRSEAARSSVLAFGYRFNMPTVTDRVLNDSIVSARQLDEVPIEACIAP